MLRKRSRPVQKDQTMSQVFVGSTSNSNVSSVAGGSKIRNTSSFSLPGLFIGFNSKTLSSDIDSVRSPTSPLDYKVFSNLGSSFVRSPRVSSSTNDSPRKSWDCNRVGLGLVDSLSGGGDSDSGLPGKVVGGGFLDNNRNIIFGSKMRINLSSSTKTCSDRTTITDPSASSPKSLPKNYVISSQTLLSSSQPVLVQIEPCEIGKIHSCSADLGRKQPSPLKEFMESKLKSHVDSSSPSSVDPSGPLHVSVGSFHELMTTLSANDIESSEDYTRIISRGPNPKTTHIFGDCILESHPSELSDITTLNNNNMNMNRKGSPLPSRTEDHFLSFCYFCKKKLVDGEDIYMYRGEKAFCSCDCRAQVILIDEETTNNKPAKTTDSSEFLMSDSDDIFLTGMIVTS